MVDEALARNFLSTHSANGIHPTQRTRSTISSSHFHPSTRSNATPVAPSTQPQNVSHSASSAMTAPCARWCGESDRHSGIAIKPPMTIRYSAVLTTGYPASHAFSSGSPQHVSALPFTRNVACGEADHDRIVPGEDKVDHDDRRQRREPRGREELGHHRRSDNRVIELVRPDHDLSSGVSRRYRAS